MPRVPDFTTHQFPLTNHSLTPPRFSLPPRFMYSAGPMLDLGYVREHLDVIEKMARDRGLALDLAPFRALDTDRRMVITSAERLKAERNKASEEIARMKKSGEDATSLLASMKQVSDEIKHDDETITDLDERLEAIPADRAEYSALQRPGGKIRGGKCRSAPLGRATAIRFHAESRIGNWAKARAFSISTRR